MSQLENLKRAITGKKKPPLTEEHKAKLKANHRSKQPGFDGSLSEETRAKIGAKAKGRKQSEETIQKKADAIRGLKREKLLCPHCSQLVAVNGYARWHGSNCKFQPKS